MDTTLIKGLHVLEFLVKAPEPQGISSLAADLKLQKSNVHRTLATLVRMGYVEQEASGCYRPTLRIWEQASRVIARHPVRRAALAFMQTLHHELAETINLIILDGVECLYLHQIIAPMPIRLSSSIGHRVPAIYTAAGKVLLAHQPNAEKIVRSLCVKCSRTYKDKPTPKAPALLAELETAHSTGYAFSMGGWRRGINSVAGIVIGPGDLPVAAIAVSGPEERMTKERMKAMTKSILNACTNTGNALGRL